MSLQSKINQDIIEALKAKDEEKLSTLRLLSAAMKNLAIEKGLEKDAELEDADAAKVVKSQIKQLKDAMADFEKAGRDDLASQNKKEIGFLSEYLPEEMGEDELRKIVKQKINEFGEPTAQDFGKVMGAVMKEVGDRADGAMVKRLVQELLAS
ncbi:MAG: GatB/YqeY domain-containing protein [candidate division Zixibacteria bacterium]|nr:GatB/YqeY domain-containing protein [candidate division Zixibacteria bacterium]NIS49503.1 GatB/YqeY domain-containing protein [Phycisphaerae bacterium]NIW96641.1 GatB/YqeY domain-containing protein [Phycisphaerae bacterium]